MKKVRFEEDESRSIRKTSLQKLALERCENWIHSLTPNEVPKTLPFIKKILPDEIESKMATGKRKSLSWKTDNCKSDKLREIPLSLRRKINEKGKERTEKIVDFKQSSFDHERKTSNLIKSLADMKRKIRKPNKVETVVDQPIEKQSVSKSRLFPVKWLGPRLKDLTTESRASRIVERQPSVPPVEEQRKNKQKTPGTRGKVKRTRIAPLKEIKLEEKVKSATIDGYDSHLQTFSGNLAKKDSSFQKVVKKNVEILLKRIRQRVSILVTDRVDVAAFEPTIDLEEERPISDWSFSQTGAEAIQPQSSFDIEGMEPLISCPFSKNESVAFLAHNLKQTSPSFANSRDELSSEKWSETGLDDKRRLKRKMKPLRRVYGCSNCSSLPTIEEEEETAED